MFEKPLQTDDCSAMTSKGRQSNGSEVTEGSDGYRCDHSSCRAVRPSTESSGTLGCLARDPSELPSLLLESRDSRVNPASLSCNTQNKHMITLAKPA